jgi:LEA14-like dessication related protein
LKYVIIVLILYILPSCSIFETDSFTRIDIDELDQEWTHSREEQVDSVEIYRPSNYKEFPISRYRQKYKFNQSKILLRIIINE